MVEPKNEKKTHANDQKTLKKSKTLKDLSKITPSPSIPHHPQYPITPNTPSPPIPHHPQYPITPNTPLPPIPHYPQYPITPNTPSPPIPHHPQYPITLNTPSPPIPHHPQYHDKIMSSMAEKTQTPFPKPQKSPKNLGNFQKHRPDLPQYTHDTGTH